MLESIRAEALSYRMYRDYKKRGMHPSRSCHFAFLGHHASMKQNSSPPDRARYQDDIKHFFVNLWKFSKSNDEFRWFPTGTIG